MNNIFNTIELTCFRLSFRSLLFDDPLFCTSKKKIRESITSLKMLVTAHEFNVAYSKRLAVCSNLFGWHLVVWCSLTSRQVHMDWAGLSPRGDQLTNQMVEFWRGNLNHQQPAFRPQVQLKEGKMEDTKGESLRMNFSLHRQIL